MSDLVVVERDNVGLQRADVSASISNRYIVTYDWEGDGAINEKVLVNVWEVRSTAKGKLQGGLDLDVERTLALNSIENLLLLLLDLVALRVQVLDNLGWTIEGGEGGNVVQRGVLGQKAGLRRGQVLLVSSLKRHLVANTGNTSALAMS